MDFKKILRYTVFAGLFFIPFIPIYISSSTFFPFITGKAFLFRIATEVAFFAWLILALKDKAYRPQKSWILYAMTAFVGIIALSDIFSGHFLKSFWSNFERMEGLVTLLHLLAYFFVLTSFIKSEKIWDRLLKTSIGASLIVGGRGFFQLFGIFASTQSGARLDGTFGNASYMAIYMFFHVFLTAYLFSKEETSKGMKWLYGAIIAFETFILIFTQTRGTILGLVGAVGLTSLLIAFFERNNKKTRKIAIWTVGLAIAVVGLFFALKSTPIVQNIPPLKRVADISLSDRTTSSRFMVWGMAYEGFKEKPILGWGQENFVFVFEKYYNPGMYAQEPWFDRAHNIFFDWLIAGGALGLLAYLSLFVLSFFSLWKSVKLSVTQKALFVGLLVGYFFHNIFVFDNIGSYIMFILVLAFIHFKSHFEESDDEEYNRPFSYEKVLTPILLVLMVFTVYFFNTKGILASKSLIQALSPQEGGIAENLEFYKKALAYNTYGNQEIREQILNASSLVFNGNVPVEIKEQFAVLGREEMQKQIDINPNSVRHQVFMGSFLNRLRLYNDALPYLERAVELSPKKQSSYFELVTNYLNSGQIEKAIGSSKLAFEFDESFDGARAIYATTLIYGDQFNTAEDLIEERYGERITGDERTARAYFEKGQIAKAIIAWEKVVEVNPLNTRFRTSLAATYLAGGMRAKAIEEIRIAIENDPSFKEQGDFFIQEIEAGRNP